MIARYLLYPNQLFGFGVDQDTLVYCVLLYPPSSTSAWKFWWVFFLVGKNFSLIFLYYKKICVLHSEGIAISCSCRFLYANYFIFLDTCTPLSIYFLEVNKVFYPNQLVHDRLSGWVFVLLFLFKFLLVLAAQSIPIIEMAFTRCVIITILSYLWLRRSEQPIFGQPHVRKLLVSRALTGLLSMMSFIYRYMTLVLQIKFCFEW